MEDINLIKKAVKTIGRTKLSKACGVTYQAVQKWEAVGRLPRTDWTGETGYASIIERLSDSEVTRSMLLEPPNQDRGNAA